MANSSTVKRIALLSITVGFIIAGCAQTNDISKPQTHSKPRLSAAKPSSSEQSSEAVKKKDLIIASPTDTEETDTSNKKQSSKLPNYDVFEPFDANKPTLMGFSIHDPIESVVSRFGKPLTKSTMDDGLQMLQVMEYPGFIIGSDENNSIVFIEVTTNQINPGLNQFRLGQTVDEAYEALGPASTLNDYVMIYEADGLILKFDLDPSKKIVLSIKLFAA